MLDWGGGGGKQFHRIAVRNMKRDLDNDLNLGRMILFGRRSLFVIFVFVPGVTQPSL